MVFKLWSMPTVTNMKARSRMAKDTEKALISTQMATDIKANGKTTKEMVLAFFITRLENIYSINGHAMDFILLT